MSVLTEFLKRPDFYRFMLEADRDFAKESQKAGCSYCNGILDQANYQRKPRGMAIAVKNSFCVRHSFCCRSCRRRTKPKSMRFLSRKVYLSLVVVLVPAMKSPSDQELFQELTKLTGAKVQTIRRWQSFWQFIFPRTSFWRSRQSYLTRVPRSHELPEHLLNYFRSAWPEFELALTRCLKFLAQ